MNVESGLPLHHRHHLGDGILRNPLAAVVHSPSHRTRSRRAAAGARLGRHRHPALHEAQPAQSLARDRDVLRARADGHTAEPRDRRRARGEARRRTAAGGVLHVRARVVPAGERENAEEEKTALTRLGR